LLLPPRHARNGQVFRRRNLGFSAYFLFPPALRPRIIHPMRVEIFDQTYHIRGDVDEAYMEELARYVDEKVRAVAAGARSMDSHRIAVLAALNLADELYAERRRGIELENNVRPRVERALQAIDAVLQEER